MTSWYEEVRYSLQMGHPLEHKYNGYSLYFDELMWFLWNIYIPNNGELQKLVLSKVHYTLYSTHLGVKKMQVLEIWLSLISTLEEVQKPLEAMGVFEEVSKVVPLWHNFKHVPQKKMLWRSLQEALEIWLSFKKPQRRGHKYWG